MIDLNSMKGTELVAEYNRLAAKRFGTREAAHSASTPSQHQSGTP